MKFFWRDNEMTIKHLIFLFLFMFAVPGGGYCVTSKSGSTAFPSLKISQGARPAAMGDCYVGLSDDVNAIYWNPAGISQMKSSELIASQILWVESTYRSNLGFVYPKFRWGSLGVGVNYLMVTGLEGRTVEDDVNYTNFSVSDLIVNFMWGKKLSDRFSLGAGFKFIRQDLYTKSYFGIAGDIGTMMQLSEKVNYGISLQNMGMEFGSDPDNMPTLLRMGISSKLFENQLILLGDYNIGIMDTTQSIGAGSEYHLGDIFAPRFGYRYKITNNNLDVLSGISAGFGIKIGKYQFDYAFTPYLTIGYAHRVDFIIRF